MVSLYEYDQAGHMDLIREEALEDGIAQGLEQGLEQGLAQGIARGKGQMQQLFSILAEENRIDDIKKACANPMYLEQLLQEYHIKD